MVFEHNNDMASESYPQLTRSYHVNQTPLYLNLYSE